MAEIFNFTPSKGITKQSKPVVTTNKFGSGYSQRVSYGINNREESWDLSFINMKVTGEKNAYDLINFLEAEDGVSYFLFTPPGETTQYKVICQDWSVEYTSHISRTIKATFVRVYDLS